MTPHAQAGRPGRAHVWRAFSSLRPWQLASLLALFASLPVWQALLDALPDLHAQAGQTAWQTTPYFVPAALSAMGCALAILFVCLLKTAQARISSRLLLAAGGLYLAGNLAVAVLALGRGGVGGASAVPTAVSAVCGGALGAGGVLLCAAWFLRVRWSDTRGALAGVVEACATAFAVHAALELLGPGPAPQLVLCSLAVLGTLGTLASLLSEQPADVPPEAKREPGREEANWWDVFGRLDPSLMGGGDEFAAPMSRGLFFVALPLLMGLAWISNGIAAADVSHGPAEVLLGSGAACLLAMPLAALKSDRALITTGFRVLLPFVALAALVGGTFAPDGVRMQLLHVGVVAYCTLYSLLMGALILSMPGRMRSLALPCAGLIALVVNLAALLAAAPAEGAAATAVQPLIAATCLLGSVALLLTTPGARMWSHMMDLIPLENAPANQAGPSLEEHVARLTADFGLTAREAQVLPALTRGHGAAFIAQGLGVSESTVRTHRTNIYRKLGVASREELISLVEQLECGCEDERADA